MAEVTQSGGRAEQRSFPSIRLTAPRAKRNCRRYLQPDCQAPFVRQLGPNLRPRLRARSMSIKNDMTNPVNRRRGASRRSVLKAAVALPLADALVAAPANKPHIAVVGAGAFGGWTALHLLRQGARVTLLDAWGPGNSRASSGGETRVIRATYGPDRIYVEMVARALQLWRENETRWGLKLYRKTGVLWMASHKDAYEKASLRLLREARLVVEELSSVEVRKRYPQINFEGVAWAIYEKDAGYLLARRACEAVLEGFLKEGGEYRQLSATPGAIKGKEMQGAGAFRWFDARGRSLRFCLRPVAGKSFSETDWRSGETNSTRDLFLWHAGGRSQIPRRATAGLDR